MIYLIYLRSALTVYRQDISLQKLKLKPILKKAGKIAVAVEEVKMLTLFCWKTFSSQIFFLKYKIKYLQKLENSYFSRKIFLIGIAKIQWQTKVDLDT